MNETIISVENLSKRYRLGQIGAKTFNESLHRAWHRLRGRDPERHMGIVDPAGGGGPSGEGREDLWALHNVSFAVARGEVLGVIGRNGAGKSTLLKILTRITDPTGGRAVLRGRVSSLLEVGTGFHPDLTGRENVYLNGAILGMRKVEIDRKFDEIVAFAEVERFIDTPVKRYSSGMYVRLAFAVAAHLEPEILLVDEVLAVGDLGFQKKCLGKMEDAARTGRTVLFVSHNMAAVSALCSRAILLQAGRLAYDGTTQETVARYVTSVQQLMEAQPLAARQDRDGGRLFRFEGVEFCDGDTRAPLDTVMSGQNVLVRIRYVSRNPRAMRDVVFSIAVSRSDGAFLFALRSDAVGRSFCIASGQGELYCHIPRMPVNQGRYVYSMHAFQGDSVLDSVREAGAVFVTAGDFYGTGKLPAAAHQGVFVEYDWEQHAGK